MTSISADGATQAIYIFQDGSDIKYKINLDGTPELVPLQCTIINTNINWMDACVS